MNKKTIAVVDDEKPIREILKVLFESKYDVGTYADGLIASNAIDSNEIKPDLVITDYNYKIPELNGLGFLERYAQKLPCILITANVEEVQQKALDLGAKVVLGKPFALKELDSAVNKYCK